MNETLPTRPDANAIIIMNEFMMGSWEQWQLAPARWSLEVPRASATV